MCCGSLSSYLKADLGSMILDLGSMIPWEINSSEWNSRGTGTIKFQKLMKVIIRLIWGRRRFNKNANYRNKNKNKNYGDNRFSSIFRKTESMVRKVKGEEESPSFISVFKFIRV